MHDMEYISIPLKGIHGEGKFTLVDGDYDGEWFSGMRLHLNPVTGYVTTKVDGKVVNFHTLVCASKPGFHVDHIDRDKLNNRSCNLRHVTPSENTKNSDWYDNLSNRPRLSEEEKIIRRRKWQREYYRKSDVRRAWVEARKKKKTV